MEHAKKMLLIDPSVIEKMNQHDSVNNPMSRLDAEMQNILKSDMEDRKKCILYLQILQRYLHFSEEGRQPLEIPIVSNILGAERGGDIADEGMMDSKNKNIDVKQVVDDQTLNEDEEQVEISSSKRKSIYSPKHILSLVPKTYIKKGERLLYLLSSNKNIIQWDDDGTIIVDKEKIPGSNIVDLVNDCLRPLKRNNPIGWKKFAQALKDIKTPLIYIGNPKILDYLKQLPVNEVPYPSHEEEDEVFSTPVTRKVKQKIDWEKWSPY